MLNSEILITIQVLEDDYDTIEGVMTGIANDALVIRIGKMKKHVAADQELLDTAAAHLFKKIRLEIKNGFGVKLIDASVHHGPTSAASVSNAEDIEAQLLDAAKKDDDHNNETTDDEHVSSGSQ